MKRELEEYGSVWLYCITAANTKEVIFFRKFHYQVRKSPYPGSALLCRQQSVTVRFQCTKDETTREGLAGVQ